MKKTTLKADLESNTVGMSPPVLSSLLLTLISTFFVLFTISCALDDILTMCVQLTSLADIQYSSLDTVGFQLSQY